MSFLNLEGKIFLVVGVANKKSVAYHIGKTLAEEGARVLYSVRSLERKKTVAKLVGDARVYVCDVEREEEIDRLRKEVGKD